MQDHFQAMKRIMRYVKGTLSYDLSFLNALSCKILGYSDTDWLVALRFIAPTMDIPSFLVEILYYEVQRNNQRCLAPAVYDAIITNVMLVTLRFKKNSTYIRELIATWKLPSLS
ncbi:hypothetical protein Tco_0282883 [Tanacetum coccineum]